ncbi:MAG: hypothetical protein H8D67_31975, partial [Deltaproteobacteria bacterium]|nr:hypothetical protein [Deltaproteobacteria bacterium]
RGRLSDAKAPRRCKEIWVEGSYEWRNPSEDLPSDWVDESKRAGYYQRLSQPITASSFVENIRQEMIDALADFNRRIPDNPEKPLRRFTSFSEVSIYFPFGSSRKASVRHGTAAKGLFRVSKLEAQPEPKNLSYIKKAITDSYVRFAQ